MINTLKYAKLLEDVGFSRDQAETSIQILAETMEDKLATKQDLQEFKLVMGHEFHAFRTEMRSDFEAFRTEMRTEFVEFKTEVRHELVLFESRFTVRMGGMLAASIAILTAIQKLT